MVGQTREDTAEHTNHPMSLVCNPSSMPLVAPFLHEADKTEKKQEFELLPNMQSAARVTSAIKSQGRLVPY